MADEKLTRELIESNLISFIEIHKNPNADRWGWQFSRMANGGVSMFPSAKEVQRDKDEPEIDNYGFSSPAAAAKFAFGYIRRHRPELITAARKEAQEGITYRRLKAR